MVTACQLILVGIYHFSNLIWSKIIDKCPQTVNVSRRQDGTPVWSGVGGEHRNRGVITLAVGSASQRA